MSSSENQVLDAASMLDMYLQQNAPDHAFNTPEENSETKEKKKFRGLFSHKKKTNAFEDITNQPEVFSPSSESSPRPKSVTFGSPIKRSKTTKKGHGAIVPENEPTHTLVLFSLLFLKGSDGSSRLLPTRSKGKRT